MVIEHSGTFNPASQVPGQHRLGLERLAPSHAGCLHGTCESACGGACTGGGGVGFARRGRRQQACRYPVGPSPPPPTQTCRYPVAVVEVVGFRRIAPQELSHAPPPPAKARPAAQPFQTLTMGCAAKACLRPTRPPTPGEARKVHDTLRTEVPSCLSACLPRLGIGASYLSAPACPCPGIAGIVVVSEATANKPCLSAPAPDHGALAVVRNVGNAACATSCCKQVVRCCSHTALHSPAQARLGGRRTSGRAPATRLLLDGSRGPTRIGVTASRPGAERAPMTALSLSFSHPPSPTPPAVSPSAP